MGFDPITMSLAANKAKADLAKNGQVGSVVPAKKYTFDGNIEGKPVMDMGDFVMVQISSDVVDVYTVQTVTINNSTFPVAEFIVGNVDEGGIIAISGLPYVMLPKTGGVFVHYKEGVDIVNEVACKETIHPIDPKYLPGVCLPVVELTTEIPVGGEVNVFTDAENKALSDAIGLPAVLKLNLGGQPFISTATLAFNEEGEPMYLIALGGIAVNFWCTNGNWAAGASVAE